MSDFLSQDQIDNLLEKQEEGAFDVKDVEQENNKPAKDPSPDYNALMAAFELFNKQGGTVISKVLNRDIKFSLSKCESANKESLQSAVSAPVLAITLPLEGAIKGVFYFLIATKDVAILSDIMMMGDGSAEYTEDHKDAIGELFNQIMGSFATSLGERCGETVSAGTIEVKEFDFSEPSIQLDDTDMVIENVNIAELGNKSMGIVIPNELSTQLMSEFKESKELETTDSEGSVGLSEPEVEDLSQVSTDLEDTGGGGDAFQEAALTETSVPTPKENVDMLLDVEMAVSIEIGKTDLSIKRILELAPGSIIELDRMAGEPVDLMVNNKVVAKGEVVVVDENFGIRIVSLVSPEERIKSLR